MAGNGRTKTQKKDDARARYKWLKMVYYEIDGLKKELSELKGTVKYLSNQIESIEKGKQNGEKTKQEN